MERLEVEICEWYEGAVIVRKTANGIDLPLDDPSLPTCAMRRTLMTIEEVENLYGKGILDNI